MPTPVNSNEYKFALKERNQQHISHTNASARKQLFRELLVVTDAAGNSFIGFVAEPEGIEAGATSEVDLMEGDVISTGQVNFTDDTFVVGNSNVFVEPQTDLLPAAIRLATAVGSFQLKALVVSADNTVGGNINLRMPTQDGNIIAAV